MSKLVLILWDQLSMEISSLEGFDPSNDTVLLCEVKSEATVVKHHKKKIAFLYSAMRHFAEELKSAKLNVHYVKLDDPDNSQDLLTEVKRAIDHFNSNQVIITQPGEYRLLECFQQWNKTLGIPVDIRHDNRFLCTQDEFAKWASGRKTLRMEYFYREMRKKYGILMEGETPTGGKWNYDSENRKPPKSGMTIPTPYTKKLDEITQEVMTLVGVHFSDHFGDLDPFHYAVTREQARESLQLFIEERLNQFGDFQDAMLQNEPWMFHSHISHYINSGLLTPMECIKEAEIAYMAGHAPLNAVEGFIRQILGWREYVRGIYWLKMPEYKKENFFDAQRPLPEFYWTGMTEMNCLRQCVLETKQNAYAHHIQRLMVLGNFALLAGLHPDEVNAWYLLVYADAHEWVELPNVTGMILFADGGFLASKPYAAGGAYINKMSNYCEQCSYKVTKKNGSKACPFNYLYWNFLAENRPELSNNHRLQMMYRTYDRMGEDKKQSIKEDSHRFFKSLGV